MSHYAKVLDGKVIQVIVAEAEFFDTFIDTSPGTWVQTSYNTKGGIHFGQDGSPDGGLALRGNYAGIGFIYDHMNDVFYPPKPLDWNNIPCASWTISAPDWTWKPPVEMPTNSLSEGEYYAWDETTKAWVIK